MPLMNPIGMVEEERSFLDSNVNKIRLETILTASESN